MKVNVKYKHDFFFSSKLMMDFIREPAYCPEWFHLASLLFVGFRAPAVVGLRLMFVGRMLL